MNVKWYVCLFVYEKNESNDNWQLTAQQQQKKIQVTASDLSDMNMMGNALNERMKKTQKKFTTKWKWSHCSFFLCYCICNIIAQFSHWCCAAVCVSLYGAAYARLNQFLPFKSEIMHQTKTKQNRNKSILWDSER